MIAAHDPPLAEWILSPIEGGTEVLWPLNADGPAQFDDAGLADACRRATTLLGMHGAHALYGEHYQEFVILTARGVATARRAARQGHLVARTDLASLLTLDQVRGAWPDGVVIPDTFIARLEAILSST